LSHPSTALFPDIVALAKKNKAQVSANPGPRQLAARGGELIAALSSIDILLINRGEAEAMTAALAPRFGEGGPALAKKGEEAPDLLKRGLAGGAFAMSLARFVTALFELGLKTLVITDGGKGSFIAGEGRLLHCPIVRTTVAGTAGAGDAFGATFAAWRALGKSYEEAAIAASHNAAGVVEHVDTQTGLHRRAALEAKMAASALGAEIKSWTL
jgi:ribokinase